MILTGFEIDVEYMAPAPGTLHQLVHQIVWARERNTPIYRKGLALARLSGSWA